MRTVDQLCHLAASFIHRDCSYLILFVTSVCNARCRMCFYWQDIDNAKNKNVLSLDEIRKIASNFHNLACLSLTGGEPTLRKDLALIIESFYSLSGTRFVTFSTNGLDPEGTVSIAETALKKCPNLRLKIYISLDGIGDKHDDIRGVKGAFSKAIATYRLLDALRKKDSRLVLAVETVLSGFNKSGIFSVIDYVRNELKPDVHSVSLARGTTREESARDVSPDEYARAVKYLNGKGRAKGIDNAVLDVMADVTSRTLCEKHAIIPCVAGKKMLTITDEADVLPCEMLAHMRPGVDMKIGNLRDYCYDIRKMIRTDACKKVLQYIRKTDCYCTFECATLCNIVFNPAQYARVIRKLW